MSFTRFHDDPVRIQKYLDESTFAGRYMLNTPGPGTDLPYLEESQIRLQKWGANITNNIINLESDFRGLTRPLNHDLVDINKHSEKSANHAPKRFPSIQPFIEESRASHPAWMYKDLEQPRWELPWINPQANFERKFPNNLQTRILEKDYHVPKLPNLGVVGKNDFFFEDFKKN
jgi:hypothetical protein